MQRRKPITILAILVGIALVAIAVVYWMQTAAQLPTWFPGHASSTASAADRAHHHVKHGVAAFVVGLACFAFAWFNSAPAKAGGAAPRDAA